MGCWLKTCWTWPTHPSPTPPPLHAAGRCVGHGRATLWAGQPHVLRAAAAAATHVSSHHHHYLSQPAMLHALHAPALHFTPTSTPPTLQVPDAVKFHASRLLGGNWDPYPIDMSFNPPCCTLSHIGLARPGKLPEGTVRGACLGAPPASRALHATPAAPSAWRELCAGHPPTLPSSPAQLTRRRLPSRAAAGRHGADVPQPPAPAARVPALPPRPHPAAVPHGHRLPALDRVCAGHPALLEVHCGAGGCAWGGVGWGAVAWGAS